MDTSTQATAPAYRPGELAYLTRPLPFYAQRDADGSLTGGEVPTHNGELVAIVQASRYDDRYLVETVDIQPPAYGWVWETNLRSPLLA